MKYAVYVGKRHDLRGERAFIRDHVPGFVLAQFDDTDLFSVDSDEPLALGWHEFFASDFQILSEG